MAVTIRAGVFETNSSSVHALSFITSEEYKAVMDGHCVVAFVPEYLGMGHGEPVVVDWDTAADLLRQKFNEDDVSDETLFAWGYCYYNSPSCYADVEFKQVPGTPGLYAMAGDVSNDY